MYIIIIIIDNGVAAKAIDTKKIGFQRNLISLIRIGRKTLRN